MPTAGRDDKINTIYTELDALDKIEQTSQVDAQRRELIADAIDLHEERKAHGHLRHYETDYIEHAGQQILTSPDWTISGLYKVTGHDQEYNRWKKTGDLKDRPPYIGLFKAYWPGRGGKKIPGLYATAEDAGIALIQHCLIHEAAAEWVREHCRRHKIALPNWA